MDRQCASSELFSPQLSPLYPHHYGQPFRLGQSKFTAQLKKGILISERAWIPVFGSF